MSGPIEMEALYMLSVKQMPYLIEPVYHDTILECF